MSRQRYIGGGGLLLLLGLVAITTRRQRIPRLRVIPEEIEQVDFTGTREATMSICRSIQDEWNTLTREYIRAHQQHDIIQWVERHRNQIDPAKPLREYIDIPDPSILENLPPIDDLETMLKSLQEKLVNLRRFLQDGCFRKPNIPALKIPLFQATK